MKKIVITTLLFTLLILNSCSKKSSVDSRYYKITESITNLVKEEKIEATYYRMSKDFQSIINVKDYEHNWQIQTQNLGKLKKVRIQEDKNQPENFVLMNVTYSFSKGKLYTDYLFSKDDNYPINITYSTKKAKKQKKAQTEEGLKDLCKDYFKLGCGITGYSTETCAVNLPEHMEVIKTHFSSCTLTNLMKPSYILNQKESMNNLKNGSQEPVLKFDAIDPTLKWCQENGVQMRGHTLVWHTQTPDWFFTANYKQGSPLVSREIMIQRMDSMIKQYMTYVQENYPGVVYCWDVVNEAVDPKNGDENSYFLCRKVNDKKKNYWYYTIGNDYPEQAFISARKYAAPGVSLFYNDYGTTDSLKRENIYKLCKVLSEKGLIDGIGMQGYWDNKNPSLKTIADTINYYAELGLEIQLTEWSMNADSYDEKGLNQQAERYASIFRLLQKLDSQGGGKANITCVSFFGVMDGYPLYPEDKTTCRIFDKNLEPKPVYYKIKDTMKYMY